MKAIKTTFHGPTNTKGSRVKATEPDGKSITIGWDHALNSEQNHYAAARALCAKMQWDGTKIQSGWMKDYYVHVFCEGVRIPR